MLLISVRLRSSAFISLCSCCMCNHCLVKAPLSRLYRQKKIVPVFIYLKKVLPHVISSFFFHRKSLTRQIRVFVLCALRCGAMWHHLLACFQNLIFFGLVVLQVLALPLFFVLRAPREHFSGIRYVQCTQPIRLESQTQI